MDHIEHERQYLLSPRAEEDLAYWNNIFSQKPPILHFANLNQNELPNNTGTSYDLMLGEQRVAQIETVMRRYHLRPSALYLALFLINLYFYTNESNIAINTIWHGRDAAKFKDTIGYFLNLLHINMDIKLQENFIEQIKQVDSVLLQAMAHSAYPFAKLIKMLQQENLTVVKMTQRWRCTDIR